MCSTHALRCLGISDSRGLGPYGSLPGAWRACNFSRWQDLRDALQIDNTHVPPDLVTRLKE